MLDSLTTVFTHELVEIISDQEPPSGWVFPSLPDEENEIADACASAYGFEGSSQVASYYSKRLNACVVPGTQFQWGIRHLSESDQLVGSADIQAQGSVAAPVGSRCLTGVYGWTLWEQEEKIVITADIYGYTVPVVTWSINGEQPPFSIEFPVNNTYDPLQQFVSLPDETAFVNAEVDGATTLTITSTKGGGIVDLDIVCVVDDNFIPAGYGTTSSDELFTSITGRTRKMDSRYYSDLTN
jgi:hypothetical protein